MGQQWNRNKIASEGEADGLDKPICQYVAFRYFQLMEPHEWVSIIASPHSKIYFCLN